MNYLEAFGFAHLILYTCIGVCKVYGKYIADLKHRTGTTGATGSAPIIGMSK